MDIREAAKALQTAAGHGARDRESVSDDDAVCKDKVKALKKRLVEYKMNDPHLPASSRLSYAAVHANMEDRDTDAGKRRRHKDRKEGRQQKKNRKKDFFDMSLDEMIVWLICPIGPLSQIGWNVCTDLGLGHLRNRLC